MCYETIELSTEQNQQIEYANPSYRERHIESIRSDKLLAQDSFYMGQFKGIGKIHLHSIVGIMPPMPPASYRETSERY